VAGMIFEFENLADSLLLGLPASENFPIKSKMELF
jgi:hypothetical protein